MSGARPVNRPDLEEAILKEYGFGPSFFAGKEVMGDQGFLEFFENSQGLQLCSYYWPAQKPKGVVVLAHGHGSYIQVDWLKHRALGEPHIYAGSWVERLNKAGYSCVGLDAQSHGRSQGLNGLRCYVRSFDDLVDDQLQVLRNLSQKDGFKNLPVYTLGLSMGGMIALLTAHRAGPQCQGACLLAPMLSLEKLAKKGMNRVLRPVVDLVAWLAPTWRIAAVETNKLFPDIQEQWDRDPMSIKGPTRAKNAQQFLRICERTIRETVQEVSCPFITFHSERDTFVDVDSSKILYDKCLSTDKTIRLVSHMWHVLVKEPGNEGILQDIMAWLDERCTRGGAGCFRGSNAEEVN